MDMGQTWLPWLLGMVIVVLCALLEMHRERDNERIKELQRKIAQLKEEIRMLRTSR